MRVRRARREQAGKLAEVQAELAQGHSQRAVAEQLRVPRATLQGWLAQGPSGDVPAALAQFYASEEGVAWLHRQVLAAQLVIVKVLKGSGSIKSER